MNNNNDNGGFLQVTVLGGDGISPIKGALVTVYSGKEGEKGTVVATDYTDNGGTTGLIPLDADNVDYNSPSSVIKVVRQDTVEVSAPGYNKSVRQNIPIFPGIVTREYIYMLPLSQKDGKDITGLEGTIIVEGSEGSFPGGDSNES